MPDATEVQELRYHLQDVERDGQPEFEDVFLLGQMDATTSAAIRQAEALVPAEVTP